MLFETPASPVQNPPACCAKPKPVKTPNCAKPKPVQTQIRGKPKAVQNPNLCKTQMPTMPTVPNSGCDCRYSSGEQISTLTKAATAVQGSPGCSCCRFHPKTPPDLSAQGLTLPVGRVLGVGVVEGLLALPDGGRQRQVCLQHPLLVAVQHRLARHGQGVALGDVLGQRGQGLLGLGRTQRGGRRKTGTSPGAAGAAATRGVTPTLPFAGERPNPCSKDTQLFSIHVFDFFC